MRKKLISLTIAVLLWGSGAARADFKYTESSKITGGMIAGMMKFAGVFNKKAREPIVTTTSVKGRHLRTDQAEGKAQIIDLEGRRLIDLDTQKRTYSVVTFDEMRAALQQLQEKRSAQGAKVKMTPKIEITPTPNTKVILGQPTREVKVRLDMQVQSEDPQQQAQGLQFTVTSDSWIAPAVKGSEEVRSFYEQMAKELDWLPGAVLGGDPQMAKGMLELKKSAATLNGLPLLQYATIGMAGMPQPAGEVSAAPGTAAGTSQAAKQETAPSEEASPEVKPTSPPSPTGAITKKLGGLFGGFGRKKKKPEAPAEPTPQAPAEPSAGKPEAAPSRPAGASGSGSLAEMTIEVTSFSNDALDAALFEIPAGFREVKEDAERILGGRQ